MREDDWVGGVFLRFRYHFHNPLQPWSSAGLSFGGGETGASSVLWAQSDAQSWSWGRVRRHLLDGLTAQTPAARERALARAFRGLGHLIHLVQDAAVPAHSRNDPHLRFNYETLVDRLRGDEADVFASLAASSGAAGAGAPDPAWQRLAPRPEAPVPITYLIDTDRYDGVDPDATVQPLVGVAEYANANFLSEDRGLPDPGRTDPFPHPSWASVEPRVHLVTLRSGEQVARWYYVKVAHGDTGYRLATVGFLRDYFVRYRLDPDRAAQRPGLDEMVYRDYAARLLPRAVGYSAALLDYFFRGRLAARLDPVPDGAGGQRLVLRVANATPGEPMEGAFTLYRELPGGARYPHATWSGRLEPEQELERELPSLPGDTSPGAALLLVFEGRLGAEPGAVAATRVGATGYTVHVQHLSTPAGWVEDRTWVTILDEAWYAYPAYPDRWFLSVGSSLGLARNELGQDTRAGTHAMVLRSLDRQPGEAAVVSVVGGCHLGPWLFYAEGPDTVALPATVELVAYEEAVSLASLHGYTLAALPRPARVLLTLTVSRPSPTSAAVALGDARFLGLRLVSQPPEPEPYAGDANAGHHTAWCSAGASLQIWRPPPPAGP
jgi:hypothetical protein